MSSHDALQSVAACKILEKGDLVESITAVRQLYMAWHAATDNPCVSKSFIDTAVNLIQTSEKWQLKVLLAACVREILPLTSLHNIGHHLLPWKPDTLPFLLSISLNNGDMTGLVPHLVENLITPKHTLSTRARSLTALTSCNLNNEDTSRVSAQLSEWLKNASVYQAPNPYSRGLFKKGEMPLVNEVDGVPVRDFFTVLCVGQYYTADQTLNMYSFSNLKAWLINTYDGYYDDGQPRGTVTAPSDGASQSAESTPQFSQSDTGSDVNNSVSEVKGSSEVTEVSGSCEGSDIHDASIQYCFRLIEQCNRKAKMAQDAELQMAILQECVETLTHVCNHDQHVVPRVFEHVKHLITGGDTVHPRVYVAVLQFLLNHSDKVMFDAEPIYEHFFHRTLTKHYSDQGFVYDSVQFIRRNLETLCYNTDLLSKYFPNIFKILAYHPTTFVQDFQEILPAIMTETTSLEILHSLLDLPCVTSSLELEQAESRRVEGSKLLQTFVHPNYRPMFMFMLRAESGIGDTINRLNVLHSAISEFSKHPRVKASAECVPHLLRTYFSVLHQEADEALCSRLVPVFIERTGLLFPLPNFNKSIKKILADELVTSFKTFPKLLSHHYPEVVDFVSNIRNMSDRELFFSHMVWAVGEYLSPVYNDTCTPDVISGAYESMETLAYEMTHTPDVSPRLVSIVMTTIAKLASRCQELIPRVLICLSKLGQQQSTLDSGQYIAERAGQLINVLKLPNVASVVLSPPPDIDSGRWHQDSTSLPVLLRTTNMVMSS